MSGGRGERCMVVGVGNIGKVICSALLRASKFVLGWAFFFYLLPGAVVAIAFRNNVVCMYKFKSRKSRFLVRYLLVMGEKLTGCAPAFNFRAMAEAVHWITISLVLVKIWDLASGGSMQ